MEFGKRDVLTIIAGFKCHDGVVVCADTQETLSIGGIALSKRNVPKLRYEEHGAYELNVRGWPELAVAFCGAGDGPFIDKLVDGAWLAARGNTTIDDACKSVEQSIKDTYQEFGQIYQAGQCPHAEIIYGVKATNEARLFSAYGPIVNPVDGFRSGGIGCYMADFLASRMYDSSLSVHQCAVLAAYILFQTKAHVDGCGGESHIAVLRDTESSGRIGSQHLAAITELLEHVDRETGKIILGTANLELQDKEFSEQMAETFHWLLQFRQNRSKELEDSLSFWKQLETGILGREISRDALGLPKPTPAQDQEDR